MSKFWGSISAGAFCVLLILISSFPVYAQESQIQELQEIPSESSVDSLTDAVTQSPEIPGMTLEEVPAEESLIPELILEETNLIIDSTTPMEVIRSEEPVPYVFVPIAPTLTDIAVLLASTSAHNATLPFTLATEKNNFAINEVPIFVLTYDQEDSEQPTVNSVVDTVMSTIVDIYDGSILDTIVDMVVDGVQFVIDLVTPESEAGENSRQLQQTITTEEPSRDTKVPLAIENSVIPEFEILEDTDEGDMPIDTSSSSINEMSEETLSEELGTTTIDTTLHGYASSSTSTIVSIYSYAVVDGVLKKISITDDNEGLLVIDFNEPFMVGEHALELHVAFKGIMYVGYYTFTVDGTVLSSLQLSDSASAMVVADTLGFQTLWLVEKNIHGLIGFQKIADETSMDTNPVLTFAEGTLFWTMSNGDVLLGFDIVARSAFSQTLNTKANQENILILQTSTYDVSVASTSIDLEFKKEKI